jgi:ParB family chromosome partitioning protein
MADSNQSQNSGGARRRLGRGLDALLGGLSQPQPDAPLPASANPELPPSDRTDVEAQLVGVGDIHRNPFQPRSEFDETSLNELAASIAKHGVLQPVLVRRHEKGFQLIAGERRWLAAQKAGLTEVPARVLVLDHRQVSEAALEENIKRKDLNVLEKAQAFQDYVERFGCTIEELGKRLSLDRSTVSNMLRLLELPDVVRQLLREEKITAGHAKAIVPLEEAAQIEMCARIQAENLSVRKTEQVVRAILRAGKPATIPITSAKPKADKPAKTPHVESLEKQLRDLLGLHVEIRLKSEQSGQVVIDFGSSDEFERLTRFLRKAA